MPDDEAVAMLVRCPQCRLAVSQISKGGHRCVCGHVSRPMTLQEYRTALRAAG
jgi:hypothetical protein